MNIVNPPSSSKRSNVELASYFKESELQPTNMQNQYHNWSCVLDPSIALSHHGVPIADNLRREIELWVVQELWNIIDNADFYARRTELITANSIASSNAVTKELIWSLGEWSRIKQERDLSRLGMYWLGDNLQESLLPNNKSVDFFQQWQSSARALDRRNERLNRDEDILNLAFRDTIALTASLKTAFVLTYQPSSDRNDSSPTICKSLEKWGISCQTVSTRNPIVIMERQYIRQLIVSAGLGKLLLAGVKLAAFHLVIPAVATSINFLHHSPTNVLEHDFSHDLDRDNYFWNNVKGVWYYL